mmetsp:Transcript_12497/g.20783  ORF Transcript_12497/g.20783 Transcript_12497/m.20783 type:complete len:93 (-) Transcript_12497:118-396(-)
MLWIRKHPKLCHPSETTFRHSRRSNIWRHQRTVLGDCYKLYDAYEHFSLEIDDRLFHFFTATKRGELFSYERKRDESAVSDAIMAATCRENH